jgi:aspartyl-tRNA synthetase
MERTDYNGEFASKTSARKSRLVGWVSTRRNLGAIEFIDLRDNTGIVQLTVPDSASKFRMFGTNT